MSKRFLALFLCIFIMIPAFGCKIFAYSDSSNTAASLKFLVDLGIVNSEIESLDNVMSREEFSIYVAKMLKLDTTLSSDVRYFKDVEPDGYAAASINMLTELGLLSVGEDRKFRPQEGIITDEALKILVTALGYKEAAEQDGGYPIGYIRKATELKILKGIDITNNTVTFGKAFGMIYNAMKAPYLTIGEVSAEGYTKSYSKNDGQSILTEIWDLEYLRGMVTAVYGSSSDSAVITKKNEIRVDGVLYSLADGLSTDGFFGEYSDIYCNSSDKKIMSLISAARAEEKIIAPGDFKSIDGNVITYLTGNGNKKKITLHEPVYVYNGYPIKSGIAEKLSNINKGSIVIKDGDGDSNYDLVIIHDYENFIVSVTDSDKTYSKLNGTPVDWNDYEAIRIVLENGIEVTTSDIQAGQSLSVARSEGQHTIEAIISDVTVTGKIEVSENDGDIHYVTVNSKSYPVDKSYAETIKDTYLSSISYVDNFEFLIDAFGNIAYIAKKASEMKTGYVISGDLVDSVTRAVAELKILTEDNRIEIYDFSDKVKINGKRYNSATDAYKNLPGNSALLDKITVKRQIIRYTLNDAGEINNILTASPTAWNGTDEAGFLQVFENDEQQRYVRGRMGQKITFSDSSLVFFIPRDETELNISNCGVSDYSILSTDSVYLTNGYLFEKDSILIDAAVCYYSDDQIPNNSLVSRPIIMVSHISKSVDQEGELQNCIEGYANGQKTKVYVPVEVSVDEIEIGDIVMFTFDYQGNVVTGNDSYEILVKRSDIENNGKPNWTNHQKYDYLYSNSSDASSNYYRSVLQLSFGYVLKTKENAIAFDHDFDGIFDETVLYTGNLMVYDSKKPKNSRVYTAKASDILTYESAGYDCAKIILRTRSQVVLEAFIYQ